MACLHHFFGSEVYFGLFFSLFLLFLFRFILQFPVLVEHAVCCSEHAEFRASVQLIACFLLLFIKLFDESGSELVAFFQPCVLLGELLSNGFRTLFSVADSRQTVGSNAFADEITHNVLGPLLRQTEVVLGRTAVVTVGCKFNGYMRIFVQQRDKFIECSG